MVKNRFFGPLILFLTALIWGTAFVAQRSGMESIGPLTFTASRMVLSAVFLGIPSLIFEFRKQKEKNGEEGECEKKRTRSTLVGGSLCGLFLVSATIFQQCGMVETSAGKAGFITALYILFVPVLNFVLFRKKGTWHVWAAVMAGVFGMYLLCMKGDFSITKGDILICICALLFSGHILVCDHFIGQVNPVQMSALQFLVASLVSLIAAFVAEKPSFSDIISASVPIIYCGIVSGGLGYTFQMIGQKYTEATVASLMMSFEAVFAVLAGALILGERMSIREILGSLILFGAVILVQIPHPGKKEKGAEGENPSSVFKKTK